MEKYQATLDVSLAHPSEQVESLRSLVEKALSAQTVVDKLAAFSKTVAEQFFEHARKIEMDIAESKGVKFVPSGTSGVSASLPKNQEYKDIIVAADYKFKQLVGAEILWLKESKGWQGDKLPSVADQAVRKVYRAWEQGVALATLSSCSAADKAARDAKKEADEAKAREVLGAGAEMVKEQEVAYPTTGNPDVDKYLKQVIDKTIELVAVDSKEAIKMTQAQASRLDNQLRNLANAVAKRAAA